MTGRRELALVVLACLAGAGLLLVAARQTWLVEVVERPAPFPVDRHEVTGADLRGWVPALGWAALAGAGALLAARGVLRRLVGGLLVLAGGAAAAGALGTAAPAGGWPVAAATGGLVVALAGTVAGARGHRWPAMGARYERGRQAPAGAATAPPGRSKGGEVPAAGVPPGGEAPESAGAAERGAPESAGRPERLWEALDRGEDPTAD